MTDQKQHPPSKKTDINQILKVAHPEIRKMLKEADKQKFRINYTGGGHYRVRTPEHWTNQTMAFTASTPSDHRTIDNTRRKLRHIGVKFQRQ